MSCLWNILVLYHISIDWAGWVGEWGCASVFFNIVDASLWYRVKHDPHIGIPCPLGREIPNSPPNLTSAPYMVGVTVNTTDLGTKLYSRVYWRGWYFRKRPAVGGHLANTSKSLSAISRSIVRHVVSEIPTLMFGILFYSVKRKFPYWGKKPGIHSPGFYVGFYFDSSSIWLTFQLGMERGTIDRLRSKRNGESQQPDKNIRRRGPLP